MKRAASLVLFLLLASACTTGRPPAPAAPAASAAPVHLVIVGTTDVHGWFDGHTDTIRNTSTRIHYGGLDILAGYLGALRAANPGHVVVVDSGDLFQGTLESNLFEGEPVVRAYNAIGYTASAVGNHEFDYGPVGPDSVVRTPGEDPLGALKQNAGAAHFPFLSANMVEKDTGRTPSWAKAWIITEVGGVKVGIVGLSTPDTPNTTVASNVATLNFTDPVPAAERAAHEARAAGADAVVVIAHMGGLCTDLVNVNDVASCDEKQEAMRFLQAMPAGTIDAYFGGHTHQQMREIVNGIPAVQSLPYSVAFSTIDLWIDPAAHHVVASRSEMRPPTMLCTDVFRGSETCDPRQAPPTVDLVPRVYEGKIMHADARITALAQSYLDRVASKRAEPLGIRSAGVFTNAFSGESTIGDVTADAMRIATGADFAVVNPGGIRAQIPPGDLTYGQLFEVSPFDNYPAVVTMTGAQLADLIRLSVKNDRGILQVSGVRYTADAAKRGADPLVSITKSDGAPLEPAALYRVAMPDFIANGGDGLDPVTQTIPRDRVAIDQSRSMRDVLIEGLRRMPMPLVPKADGRITVLNAPPRQ
jgi:5'-nucleotidase